MFLKSLTVRGSGDVIMSRNRISPDWVLLKSCSKDASQLEALPKAWKLETEAITLQFCGGILYNCQWLRGKKCWSSLHHFTTTQHSFYLFFSLKTIVFLQQAGRGWYPNKCHNHSSDLSLCFFSPCFLLGLLFLEEICPQSSIEKHRNCFVDVSLTTSLQ